MFVRVCLRLVVRRWWIPCGSWYALLWRSVRCCLCPPVCVRPVPGLLRVGACVSARGRAPAVENMRWFPRSRWSALLLGQNARPLGSACVRGGRVAAACAPWPAGFLLSFSGTETWRSRGGKRGAASEAAPTCRLRPAGVGLRSLLASVAWHGGIHCCLFVACSPCCAVPYKPTPDMSGR